MDRPHDKSQLSEYLTNSCLFKGGDCKYVEKPSNEAPSVLYMTKKVRLALTFQLCISRRVSRGTDLLNVIFIKQHSLFVAQLNSASQIYLIISLFAPIKPQKKSILPTYSYSKGFNLATQILFLTKKKLSSLKNLPCPEKIKTIKLGTLVTFRMSAGEGHVINLASLQTLNLSQTLQGQDFSIICLPKKRV